MFAAGLHHPTTEIRATSTISQHLAEAFRRNEDTTSEIPDYLCEFNEVFSKESFDVLPEHNRGIMPLSLFQERNPLVARCIRSLHPNNKS